jgi:hypothetical protein
MKPLRERERQNKDGGMVDIEKYVFREESEREREREKK